MFPQRLKELREKNNLRQSELAKILNISTASIGMYEQGRRFPDYDILSDISVYFKVSFDYLLGRSDIPNPYLHIEPEFISIITLLKSLSKEDFDKATEYIMLLSGKNTKAGD